MSSSTTQACFPSSSSRQRPRPPRCRREDEAYHPPIGFLPPSDKNTLAVPFALAYLMWCATCKSDCPSRQAHSSGRPHHHGPVCALGPAAEHGEILTSMSAELRCIGTSFKACMHQMRYFVVWDTEHRCVRIDSLWNSSIDAQLRAYGFDEDALGQVQPGMLPKCADKQAAMATPAKNKQGTAGKTETARSRDKMREQLQSETLLADCARFASTAEADAAERTHMSNKQPLAQVLRALNRAVLAFGTRHSDNLIYTELAALVALLNYAAAFYHISADVVEQHLQDNYSQSLVEHYFFAVCSPRWTSIEAEEHAAARDRRTQPTRARRLRELQQVATSFVPDTMELRDGAQLVLHTFVWINYTSFRSADEAMAAMLHSLIPLLQTVVMRCAKQAYVLQRLLCTAPTTQHVESTSPPSPTEVQWDLVNLSSVLQNLSGSEVPLYTSFYRGIAQEGKRKPKRRPHVENTVRAPAMAHLYSMYAIDVTLDTLCALGRALAKQTREHSPLAKAKSAICTKSQHNCHAGCTHPDAAMLDDIAILSAKLRRLERTQPNWIPMLSPKKTRKKKSAAGAESKEAFASIKTALLDTLAYGNNGGGTSGDPKPGLKTVPKAVPEPMSKPVSKARVAQPVVSKPAVSTPVAPASVKGGSGKATDTKAAVAPAPAKGDIRSDVNPKAAAAPAPGQGDSSKTAKKVFGPEPPPSMPLPMSRNVAELIKAMADHALAQPDYVAPPLSGIVDLPANLATLGALMTSPSWQPPEWMNEFCDQLSRNEAASRGILELAGLRPQ
ncbi:hypothetical protein PaG_01346 [Moesziomyces aphidis]|uniref:Uncharacterized protein n=1 Tax=Moesziomyces aphidis TaxID=84754 RepID=W3VTI1_MOEAP|nr:hypothetical protein PaG_01346 [Moesziomyces aphidis]